MADDDVLSRAMGVMLSPLLNRFPRRFQFSLEASPSFFVVIRHQFAAKIDLVIVVLNCVNFEKTVLRVQACCYDSPVFGGQSSDVSERLLHSGHRRQQPTPTFSHRGPWFSQPASMYP